MTTVCEEAGDLNKGVQNRSKSGVRTNRDPIFASKTAKKCRVSVASVKAQELCESRGGRPRLPSLDVKQHFNNLNKQYWVAFGRGTAAAPSQQLVSLV